MKIVPKKENENIGFNYSVSEEQLAWYSQMSIEEKFAWLQDANSFILSIQTEEEKQRTAQAKNFKW
jgi:hypothetical protein